MKLDVYASNHLIRDAKTDELLMNCATDERATEVARRLNAHEALVEALKAMVASCVVADGQKQDQGYEAFKLAKAALVLAVES